MNKHMARASLLAFLLQMGFPAFGWDYEGHRVVNQLALTSLPADFPAFARSPAAAERIAFLGGEADRWRNVPDLALRHCNGPDHYIDVEELESYGLNPAALPVFRYDFVAKLALIRQAHPDKFPEPPAARNEDHTRELVGLLPWAITENCARLKSAFSYLRAYQQHGGTAQEVANAEANVICLMGVMGHYVADASQPLHTTIHHHGWVGANPNGYSTNSRIHSWIDGGYLAKVGGPDSGSIERSLREARLVELEGHPAKPEEVFQATVKFILEQHRQVETLYRLEKQGQFSGQGETRQRGKLFLEGQLLKSAQFLGDLWYSAWQQAPPDLFLERQLTARKPAGNTAPKRDRAVQ